MPVPLYDIPSFVPQYIPPNKRLPKYIAGIQGFLSGLTWNMFKFLAYKNGETLLAWNIGATYNTGDKVQWNFATYESLTDVNTGNQPDLSIISGLWTLRCASFIGADERVKYNGRYLVLTWALNRYFQTTFRQPPYPAPYDFGLGGGTFSDIYITNLAPDYTPFVFGIDSSESSTIGLTDSGGAFIPLSPDFGLANTYTFIVHMPVGVYTVLGATTAIRDSVVRGFVDRYCPSGITYNIVTY